MWLYCICCICCIMCCICASAVSDVDVKNTLITSKSCSYPFTFNGILYFSGVQSNSSLCEGWCLNMNAQRLTCSKDDYGNFLPQTFTLAAITQKTRWQAVVEHKHVNKGSQMNAFYQHINTLEVHRLLSFQFDCAFHGRQTNRFQRWLRSDII